MRLYDKARVRWFLPEFEKLSRRSISSSSTRSKSISSSFRRRMRKLKRSVGASKRRTSGRQRTQQLQGPSRRLSCPHHSRPWSSRSSMEPAWYGMRAKCRGSCLPRKVMALSDACCSTRRALLITCVCVCVCEREREREREKQKQKRERETPGRVGHGASRYSSE